ncbi:uncharacterized protein L3040_001882 [Drepanopeziza brunnea f. sp. 'multigermtubi']|uniref:uncharacterized protein n=1 Tax=Drepanopeziza brunnea f. sp. 'multigermtubi' TaxID=698441 RepID=UPI0023A6E95D|nr:hypothetical protein L3040_001882 [Drepanopeziza brunnea f. sp. 'multigermtubi']
MDANRMYGGSEDASDQAGDGRLSRMRSAHSSFSSFDNLIEKDKSRGSAAKGEDMEEQPSLKLFQSNLAHARKKFTAEEPNEPIFIEISGPRSLAMPNIFEAAMNTAPEHYKERLGDAQMRETPEFKRYEEATNIELFYDLFFVANLTTFTDVHEINAIAALKAYAGFFCILWFLWVQVSLFDVRFVEDSILERIGKACQFGVMIGLAIVGPSFNPEEQRQDVFRSLAIILMLSRVVLALQYGLVLYQVFYYKGSRKPLVLIVGSNLFAALLYFSTFFGFKPDNPRNHVFVLWYITAVLETAFNIIVSSKWEVLTFQGTHLIKRMSLLTLIILGEGIIAFSKSIATITEQEENWNGPLLLTIGMAVIIVYFIYMIYFDWINRNHFGSFREGLWALLHFPFHLALVLLLEGAAQFIVWRKVVEVVRSVNELFLEVQESFKGNTSTAFAELLSNTTNEVFERFPPVFTRTLMESSKAITAIGSSTFNSPQQREEVTTLFAVIQDSIFDNFKIEPPEVKNTDPDPNTEWAKNADAFKLIFIYFFAASGITLILMNALNFLSRTKPTRFDYARIAANFVIGAALVSITGFVNTSEGFRFAQSAFILPTVGFAFVLVMALAYTKLLR